jgi:ABC-type glycerol-3-phosphate transport system permease component
VERNILWRTILSQGVLHAILIVAALACTVPFLWMVTASFKNYKELVSTRTLLPQVWTLQNYRQMMTHNNFFSAFRASAYLATVTTVAVIVTSSYLGYIFAKYRFPGKEILFTILLATMMVPFTTVMIPLYITISDFGLLDSHEGIILVSLWSTFGIFMMRQFMESLPDELIDAARIDGASELRIFATLIVPLSAAPLGALAVFTFLGNWDSLIWPMITLHRQDLQTLPLLLQTLRGMYWTRYEIWAAGSMLTVTPVMIIYAFASKYFIRGIAMTGLKA